MRSKLRAPVLQNLSNFVHKPTPAAPKTALQRGCCNTHAGPMEPLTWRDKAWIYSFCVAGVAIWGLVAYAVLA
jgi:hypothetical protein